MLSCEFLGSGAFLGVITVLGVIGAALISVNFAALPVPAKIRKILFWSGLVLVVLALLGALVHAICCLPPPPPLPSPTPTQTPTVRPTDTTPSPIDKSGVRIECIFSDGQVPSVESDEYVQITNFGPDAQNLEGWTLKDISEGYPSLVFPPHILGPEESIRVYTNEYHPEWGGFSFEHGKAAWHNTAPDEAALYNAQGQEVSRKSYPPRSGGCK